jgi:hypothetical protein
MQRSRGSKLALLAVAAVGLSPACDASKGPTQGSGDAGGAPAISALTAAECHPTCTSAADCAFGGALYDQDNWACTEGTCEYKGCRSTQECTDQLRSPKYVCAPSANLPFNECFRTCSAAADCTSSSAPTAFDADNWACTGGKCEYKGCRSTQECTDTYESPDWTCAPSAGLSFNECVRTCSAAADCTSSSSLPAFDADNWACTAGKCEYKGCSSTQECTDTHESSSWVCK